MHHYDYGLQQAHQEVGLSTHRQTGHLSFVGFWAKRDGEQSFIWKIANTIETEANKEGGVDSVKKKKLMRSEHTTEVKWRRIAQEKRS